MPSSINNPIAFFQEFLFNGYFNFFKAFYHPGEDAYLLYDRLLINEEKKTRDIAYPSINKYTGEEFSFESIDYFPDLLTNLLKTEKFKSLQLINEMLNISTVDGREIFIESLYYQIIKLDKDFKEQIADQQDFDIISTFLKDILFEILSTYPNVTLKSNLNVQNFLKKPKSKTTVKGPLYASSIFVEN